MSPNRNQTAKPANDVRWRYRVAHNCDSARLRNAALARLTELRQKAADKVKVVHEQRPGVGLDVVRVTWAGTTITVVVAFPEGQALVGIAVPKMLALFKGVVLRRVTQEVRDAVAVAGGSWQTIEEVAVE